MTVARPKWEPDGWWRVLDPDGGLWCESSDEQENRENMRPGDTLWHHEWRVEQRWVQETCPSPEA